MTNTETKLVKIVPKQPRFISDILELPARIDEEIELELNIREIIRCMQYADVYDENGVVLTPFDIMEVPVQSEGSEGGDNEGSGEEPGGSGNEGGEGTGGEPGGDDGTGEGSGNDPDEGGDNEGSGGSGNEDDDDVWNDLGDLMNA